MHKVLRRSAVAAVIAGALGCAPALRPTPTTFSPARSTAPRTIVLQEAVEATPAWGYTRTLKAGSVWRALGTVPEGTVYKIEDDVFMLEAKHMHEAYCIVSGNTLVGFFLPVEQAFVAVNEKIQLPLKAKSK